MHKEKNRVLAFLPFIALVVVVSSQAGAEMLPPGPFTCESGHYTVQIPEGWEGHAEQGALNIHPSNALDDSIWVSVSIVQRTGVNTLHQAQRIGLETYRAQLATLSEGQGITVSSVTETNLGGHAVLRIQTTGGDGLYMYDQYFVQYGGRELVITMFSHSETGAQNQPTLDVILQSIQVM